jgi:dihydrofolate synthase/folylpolyglutamate synthase
MSPEPGRSDPFEDLIEPFSRRGIDLGLERIRAALSELGHPERSFAAVQVAGTNGKGSICRMLHEALSSAGLRCGLYTSPHLLSWCERIQLGPDAIGVDRLRALLTDLRPLGLRHDLTPFELVTVAAFAAFAEAGLEIAVLEVGLGGRLDATTVHPAREVVGFGAIGIDHAEVLGPDLASIAGEKAGILSRGCLGISAPQNATAAAVLEATASRSGSSLRWVQPLASPEDGGPRLGLAGQMQRCNGAVALAMTDALRERGWAIPPAAAADGLARCRWTGRLERRRHRGHELLIDGAHNPPAAEALRRELDQTASGAARRWLIGIQRHKDAPAMLRQLLRPGDTAALVPLPGHASWTQGELRQASAELGCPLGEIDTPQAGLDWLVAPTEVNKAATPVVAGSLLLVAAVLPLLEPQDAADVDPRHPG